MSHTTFSSLWTRIISVVLLLVVFLMSAGSIPAQAQGDGGPFFIFPPGTKWRANMNGFHTSCSATKPCPWIMGIDYVAPQGTPILAPFEGTIKVTCTYRDGVNNTVLYLMSDDGWVFGGLHMLDTYCLDVGTRVKAGEQIALVGGDPYPAGQRPPGASRSPQGMSTTAHVHAWFGKADPNSAGDFHQITINKDHAWFFNGGVALAQSGGVITQPSDPGQTVSIPDPQVLYSKTYNVSRHASGFKNDGSYVWPNYAYNVLHYFYYVDHGNPNERRTATDLYNHDEALKNFSGSYTFGANQEIWINGVFGPYSPHDGMRESEVGGIRQGGGACNSSSMVVEVLSGAGCSISNTVRHSTDIPEIDYPGLHSIAVATARGGADPSRKNGSDALIVCPQDVTLRWDIAGDQINLSALGGVVEVVQTNPAGFAANPSIPGSSVTTYSRPVGAPMVTMDYVPGQVLFTVPIESVVEQNTEKPLPNAFDIGKYINANQADGSTTINLKGIWDEFKWVIIFASCVLFLLYYLYAPRMQKDY